MKSPLFPGKLRRVLPTVFILLLLVSRPCLAQEPVRVFIGNPDCLAFNVPGTGDIALPLWIDIPGPIGGGTMTLYKDSTVIPEWLGVNFIYPWQYTYEIRDGALRLMLDGVSNPLDTLIQMADILFSINADPSQYGQAIQAVTVGRLAFSDTTGYYLIEFEACVSPLCIECASSTDNPALPPDAISLGAYPNPFNTSTVISYTLPSDGDVALSIFDIQGRRVKSLVSGWLPAGEKAITWHGDNDRGKRISTGVYFCLLEIGGQSAVLRVTLVK